jgi:hypothetical protein
MRKNKKIDRFRDSEKSGNALMAERRAAQRRQ